jgi:hypothetical protein
VPGIKYRLISPEAAAVFADNAPSLPQLDLLGIGAHLDRPSDRTCSH